MARLGSDNQVDILIKADADTKGIDQTTHSIGRLEQSAGGGGKGMALLGGAAKLGAVGIAAAGAAIGVAGTAAIKSAGSYEQSRIAFEVMLGSADKAKVLMGQIAEFAKSTPFELPEVVAGTKQLLAFGFAQDQLLPTMKKLGDIASGVGVPVGQLTNVFGQVRVAGKLMGGDLLQFTNAGVPMIEALANTMKKPQSEIKKLVEEGKVGFPEVEKAINSLTGEGSKFGGMMDKQSKSFSGVVSNIKDGFGQILRNAVGITVAGDIIEGGLFDRVKAAAERLIPIVAKVAENIGPFMMNAIDGTINAFKKARQAIFDFVTIFNNPSLTSGEVATRFDTFVQTLRKVWDVIYNALAPSIKTLVTTFQDNLLPTLQRLWNFIEPYILPTLKVLGIILGVVLVGAIWVIVNALNIMIQIWTWFANVMIEVYQRVIWLVNVIIQYFTFLWQFWSTIFNAIYTIFKTIFQAIFLYFAVIISMIMAVVQPIGEFLARPFNWAKDHIIGAWQHVMGWFRNIGAWISGAVSNVYGILIGPFSRFFDYVSAIPGRIVNAVGDIGRLLRNKLGDWDIPGPLGKVRDVIPGFAAGGYTGAGGTNEVAGLVHRGEYVVPKNQVDQSTGLPKMGGANTTTNIYGDIHLGDQSAVDRFFAKLDRNNELAQKGLTTIKAGA